MFTINPSHAHANPQLEEMHVELSSCCGAPLTVEYQSDATNFTDDDYDFRVPVKVCSKCGAVVDESDVRPPRQAP